MGCGCRKSKERLAAKRAVPAAANQQPKEAEAFAPARWAGRTPAKEGTAK